MASEHKIAASAVAIERVAHVKARGLIQGKEG